MIHPGYRSQLSLLLRILPFVAQERTLALHGGTAINLFRRNMPRLSVDIDLTYLPVKDRRTSFAEINEALAGVKERTENSIPGCQIYHLSSELKLNVVYKGAVVKVEVNQIKRGCYLPPKRLPLCKKAQDEFQSFAEMNVVEDGHLFGGKICAALDRQHPRDMFDVQYLLQKEGFNEEIKKGFLFYLISSNRPIVEILFPHLQDRRQIFENQFVGMSQEPFSYDQYSETRAQIIQVIQSSLNPGDKQFLIELEKGEPTWRLYDFQQFPAVEWKLMNIRHLKETNIKKHHENVHKLQAQLFDKT